MTSLATKAAKPPLTAEVPSILVHFGVSSAVLREAEYVTKSQISDDAVARLKTVDTATADEATGKAHPALLEWLLVSRPERGGTDGGHDTRFGAWKTHVCRTTNTMNSGRSLPLVQGVKPDVA